jgi:putative sterol carrier protein
MVRRNVNPEHGLKRPTTYQWDFTDADVDTWHLVVDNGSSRVERGPAPSPDARLALSYQDWVDIVGQRLDPVRALATRRLRPHGSLRALGALRRVFPQS